MSYACLILGESGTGKTCSLRNLDPKKTFLVQPVRKPLPFRSAGWKEVYRDADGQLHGNIFVSDDPVEIVKALKFVPDNMDVIVIDDWQYVLANLFMAKRTIKGFDKFTEIAGAGFDLCHIASQLPNNKRVYILAHTTTDDFGNVKIKTLGKLLDDKIVPEGMFTTVLRTHVENGKYSFQTHNGGSDTVKSPMGMFADDFIDNDLALVDQTIQEYYGINNSED